MRSSSIGIENRDRSELGGPCRGSLAWGQAAYCGSVSYLVASKRTKELVHDILEANPNLEIHFSTNSIAAADHPIVAAVSLKQQALQLNQLKYRIYQFALPESVEAFIPPMKAKARKGSRGRPARAGAEIQYSRQVFGCRREDRRCLQL